MGTPDFAVSILEALIQHQYNVIAVISQPDKPTGRKQKVLPTPVKEVALQHGIPVFQPIKIRKEYNFIADLKPDLIVTCAYGQIVPKEVLEMPTHGCINVHASLLPKLRGGAPIHHALLRGFETTGITIMQMSEKMDAGPLYASKECKILKQDNLESLYNKLKKIGANLLMETLPSILAGLKPIPQDEAGVTYAFNIKREEEKINWLTTSTEIFNQIRALSPTPGAYSVFSNQIIKFYDSKIKDYSGDEKPGTIVLTSDELLIKTLDGAISILELQLSGKKKMDIASFLRGQSLLQTGMYFEN